MRKPTPTLIILLLVTLRASIAAAQPPATPPSPVTQLVPIAPVRQEPTVPATPVGPEQKRLEPFVSITGAFDSNINHDKDNVNALGGVFGAGLRYRSSSVDPALELTGEVAGHSYTNSSRWDRFSQKLIAAWQHDLPGRWKFDATGEVSLKGSTEDREISNQYVVIPRIAYRISPQTRVRAYGALRARRYDDDPDRNAFNRYVGIEFTERATADRRWEVDLRYEVNATESPRQHYERWTFGSTYSFLVSGADRIEVEVRYRMQRYPFRLVEVDDIDVPRRDHRWIPKITWARPLGSGLHVRAGYTAETRMSNDLDREFTAHLFSVTFIRYWGQAASQSENR